MRPFENNHAFRVFSISLRIARRPRVFHMLSISLVNDSELHDQSHFADPVCGSGLHGRQHTPRLLAHSPALTASTHAACGNLICGLTPDLHLGMWHLRRESVSDTASHLKKSLTIKCRSEGWFNMVAEQHGSSSAGWNSNVFSRVAVSSLIPRPLTGKNLTTIRIMSCSCSQKQFVGQPVPTQMSLFFLLFHKCSYCIQRRRACLSLVTGCTRCTLSVSAVWMEGFLLWLAELSLSQFIHSSYVLGERSEEIGTSRVTADRRPFLND